MFDILNNQEQIIDKDIRLLTKITTQTFTEIFKSINLDTNIDILKRILSLIIKQNDFKIKFAFIKMYKDYFLETDEEYYSYLVNLEKNIFAKIMLKKD
jgi:hypothetical protein